MKKYVKSGYVVPLPKKYIEKFREEAPGYIENLEANGIEPSWEFDDEDDYIKQRYDFVKLKDVRDFDGFLTTYMMYYDTFEDRYVFVFDEDDLFYENFDWECESQEEANEWMDDYSMADEE